MKKTPQEKKHKLSERELKEIMGINKQTYKRAKGGALMAK